MADFERDLRKYRSQIDEGFRKLQFEGSLEEEFIDQYYDRNITKQRTAIIVAIILMLLLIPFDYFVLNEAALGFYLFVRLGLTVPLLAFCYFGTYLKIFRPYFQISAFVVVVLIGVGTNLIVTYTAQLGVHLPYEGIILIIFVGFLLAGMRFRYSLVCAVLLFISYIISAEIYTPNADHLLHNYFFIFAATVIGATSAYTLEYQSRLGFLQRGALRNLAKIDPLTGLLNRGAINQQLEILFDYAYREKRYLTLLLVDADYFKKFNDLYGHIQGDFCLTSIANSLSQCCRRSLDFAGRYGGEEFILLWFDTKPEEMASLSNLVKERIANMHIEHKGSLVAENVTASGGMVTGIPSELLTPQVYLQKADECLYEAKRRGRNQILCYSFDD